MNHYKNNLLEELHRLTEAVQASHADIAPTYLEYTQLAFAIATDCGEAGRADFMSLCSLSPKHDSAAAEKLFSNALHTCKGDIHLGSVFHLAEMCGVRVAPSHKNADADAADAGPFFSHTCARYNKVENEEKETGKKIDVISLSYNRLMNHIKYMVARAMTGEDLRINMNEYIESKFPEAYMTAKKVCDMLGKSIGKELDEMEIGYLAMHIERIYSEEIKA